MTIDSELYTASKQYVKDKLSDYYNKSENVLILSVSRKGPKFLERLFGRTNSEIFNTVTEVALPFCMKRLASKKKTWCVKVFDDAVYYGTTIEGIIHELEAFEGLYGLELKKELYTAIRAKESHAHFKQNLNNVEIHSYNDDYNKELRSGYGHYFIRRLEKDLAESDNTLEIEFPIVEFEADGIVDRDKLFSSIEKVFGSLNCYVINHAGHKNLSIVLRTSEGQSFNKIRIYVKDTFIRVVCMSPWILPNDVLVLLSLFRDSPFEGIWYHLMSAYTEPSIGKRSANAYSFMPVERSIRKSLVIMANYLLSCGQLISQKSNLLHAFLQAGVNIQYKGIQTTDLFYLLGDEDICKNLQNKMNDVWDLSISGLDSHLTRPNCKVTTTDLDYQIFEQRGFPEREEVDIFERHNKEMIVNSQNAKEALSALFYNQTALIEKWSRRNEKYDFGRLRFGYTFASLKKALYEAKIENKEEYNQNAVHQWIDYRIDQACVVPQYIVDHKTNLWCRVFRPGENEDALLSHLIRFVLSVFYSMDEVQRLGWVYRNTFEELLCFSVCQEEGLNDYFEFELVSDMQQRRLMLKYGNDTNLRSVFDYLIDMKIINVEEEMVSVSNELADDDLRKSTTLDSEVERRIHDRIKYIMELVVKYKYQRFPFFVTNLFFYCEGQINSLINYNRDYLKSLETTVSLIEQGKSNQDLSSYIYKNYLSSKKYIVSIDLFTDKEILISRITNSEERCTYAREMIVMWMIKFIYELIIITHLYDNTKILNQEINEAKPFEAYGNHLEWDDQDVAYFKELLSQTDNMAEIRKQTLSWVKEKLKIIPNVKVLHHE